MITTHEIASRLEALAHRPIRTASDLAAWRAASDDFRRWLTDAGGVDLVPHFVWHYLADVDIRYGDPAYRTNQDDQLESVLVAMRA